MDRETQKALRRLMSEESAHLSEGMCPKCKGPLAMADDLPEGEYAGDCPEHGIWTYDGTSLSWHAPERG
jgi:hypothetical protein